MEQRFGVHAGAYRQALIVALLVSTPAIAAPKGKAAKAAFGKGVAAYQKNDFAGAATAFGKSYALEADPETLFAWAQAERKQQHCDKATELYTKLLALDLPQANKDVIKSQILECKQILDAQKPAEPEPKPIEAKPEPEPKPVEAKPEPKPEPEPVAVDTVADKPIVDKPAAHHWYADPVGDALSIVGLGGIGFGVAMLVSGNSAAADEKTATSYDQFKALDDKAKSRGQLGVIGTGVGAGLLVAGIVWYATHGETHATTVTGWVTPESSGIGIAGGF